MDFFKHKHTDPEQDANDPLTDEEDFSFDVSDDRTDTDYSGGLFANSLDELGEDDIPLSDAALVKERVSVFEIIRRVLFWFFLIAFLASSFYLVRNLIQKQRGKQIYSQLQEEFFSTGFSFDVSDAFRDNPSETPGVTEDQSQRTIRTMTELLESQDSGEDEEQLEQLSAGQSYNEELEKMRAGLQALQRKNPDIYGWISIEGTNINYPITQSDDNAYYLDHAANGDFNPFGSVFADYRCDRSITRNYNTVFYGHNIINGAMFHDVTKFFNDDYFDNVKIYVFTIDGIYVYEPFSIYEARYDYQYFQVGFKTADRFIEFAEEMRDNSAKKKDVTFTERDRILTLSTCTNGPYTQRYALHAKLIRTILD